MKLKKSLYGLRQSGKLWYLYLKEALLELNFKTAVFDPCLFIKPEDKIRIVTYVDDCLVSGPQEKVEDTIRKLGQKYKLKVTSLNDFLGITIKKNDNKIELSMTPFIEKSVTEIGLDLAESSPAQQIGRAHV